MTFCVFVLFCFFVAFCFVSEYPKRATSTTSSVHRPQQAYTHFSSIAHICLVIHNLELYATDATSHRSRAHFRQLSLALCTPLKCELINTEPQGVFEPHCLDLIAWALCFCTN